MTTGAGGDRPITIREATPEDASSFATCVEAVARERRFLASTKGFGEAATRDYLRTLIDSNGVVLAALRGEEVVAWCDIMPGPFEGLRHSGRLGMGVLADFRGQGIGRELLRRAVARAFDQGLSRIELEVFATNEAAIRLYEQEAFVHEGRKRRARLLDGTYDDALVMARIEPEESEESEEGT